MLPIQTWQIILGIAVAVLYGGAVLAIGMLVVMAIVPHAARTAIRAQGGRTSLVWLGFVLGQGCLGVGWLALSLAGLLYAQLSGVFVLRAGFSALVCCGSGDETGLRLSSRYGQACGRAYRVVHGISG